jgi:hypothetical protein
MVLVHFHVHGACPSPCPWCMSMSMLSCPRCTSMFCPVHHRCVCVCKGVFVFVCVFINAEMLDCPASDQSGTGMKKLMMPGLVRYCTTPRQSGIFLVQYRTETTDAGMLMPALVSSMPMPSYGIHIL